MTKRFRIPAIVLVLVMLLCACAEIPPVSSESAEPSTSPDPTPTENAEPPEKVSVLFDTLGDALDVICNEDAETYKEGVFAELFSSVRQEGYVYAPAMQNGVTWGNGWNAAFKAKTDTQAGGMRYRVQYNGTTALIYVVNMQEADGKRARADLAKAYNGVIGQKSQAETVLHKLNVYGKETTACGTAVQNGLKYTIWFMLDDTHFVSVEWFTNDATAAEEFVSKLWFQKATLRPVTAATLVPTKKPTATPTVKPTATPKGSIPDYLRATSFDTIDGLRKFLLTEKDSYEKGHYASLFQSVRARGYFLKPVFTDEIQFRTKNGMVIALAVTESWFETPSVAYRLLYRDSDVLLYIHEIEESNSQTVREHLYAHQSGKDLRQSAGLTLDVIKDKGFKETKVTAKRGEIKTWGRVVDPRYRIWFMLDDTHLVQVEWFTNDAAAAEEFVSKLEFEKVELQPATEVAETTP